MSKDCPNSALVFVVSGPGGAGKSTMCRRLVGELEQTCLSISTTSRLPRGEEQDGVDYFFVSRQKFEEGVQAGKFVEHAQVAGNYYGTPRDYIDGQIGAGSDVFLDIDVQGGSQVRDIYGSQAVSVFVLPPNGQVLESRLRGRGTDSDQRISQRMELAQCEIEAARSRGYDYLIVNDDLEDSVAELIAIRRAEHRRVTREGSRAAWVLKTWK
jgi:guanylate kinase